MPDENDVDGRSPAQQVLSSAAASPEPGSRAAGRSISVRVAPDRAPLDEQFFQAESGSIETTDDVVFDPDLGEPVDYERFNNNVVFDPGLDEPVDYQRFNDDHGFRTESDEVGAADYQEGS